MKGVSTACAKLPYVPSRDVNLRNEGPIAAGLAEGDPDVVDLLWAEYGDRVLATALSALRDRAEAEDVRQQVFTEVWERRGKYDPARGSVRSWVMTIARSRTIDQLRARRPTLAAEELERIVAPADPETTPEAAIDRLDVADMLRRIPGEEAGLLRMRFHEGLSQREIAERTGIPLGTVKMRMVQALERMRGLLDAERGQA
jgi:RNA polymerase sigma-70 factor (ECF subfamily)